MSDKKGLWDNIQAKRERIKHGSGEHMRKPGSKGAPTKHDFKMAAEAAPIKTPHDKSKHFKTGETAELQSTDPNDSDSRFDATDSAVKIYKNATPGQSKITKTIKKVVKEAVDKAGYKSETGGLTQKGRDHYNRETGSHLQAPVTKKPSELKTGSKAANRRKSFCARVGGMKGPMKDEHGKPTRKALALRKWNC